KPAVKADKLDILMENMGRVNYGVNMEHQHKGIKDAVTMNLHQHYDWTMYPLPLNNTDKLSFTKPAKDGLPAFYKFEFEGDSSKEAYKDTFLDLTGFGKGCAFINGFNLGRFWEIGPQKRLYVPGPLVKEGKNEIIVFETEGKSADFVTLLDEPELG
ncbi:MAG: beta-galactosidase, partial [Lachnospiraceae bacterium]|nr:beta-galactosidase [Lachnospiraceae bacterium]